MKIIFSLNDEFYVLGNSARAFKLKPIRKIFPIAEAAF